MEENQEINTMKPDEPVENEQETSRVESEVEAKRLKRELVYLKKHTTDVSTTRKGEAAKEVDKRQRITNESF